MSEERMRTFTFRFPESIIKEIDEICKSYGCNRNEFVRIATLLLLECPMIYRRVKFVSVVKDVPLREVIRELAQEKLCKIRQDIVP